MTLVVLQQLVQLLNQKLASHNSPHRLIMTNDCEVFLGNTNNQIVSYTPIEQDQLSSVTDMLVSEQSGM